MDNPITVTELNRYIKSLFSIDENLRRVTVKGEISNFKNHERTGHFYFTLKDGASSIRAVMFQGNARKVRFQVENGMSATVPLVAADSFAWPLAEGESLELDVELAGSLRAPIRAGRRAGEAVFSVNGKEVGRVALLYGADVAPRMESALSILKQGLPG